MPRKKDSGGWFKVHSSILDDPAIGEIGNEGLGVYIRILAMLNRTRSADGKLTVSDAGLCALSGKRRIDVSEKTVRLLEEVGLSSLERLGKVWEITVPKWSIYNGMGSNSYTPKGTHQDQDQDQDQNQDQNQHLISLTKSPLGTPDGAPIEDGNFDLMPLSDGGSGGFDVTPTEPPKAKKPKPADIAQEAWPMIRSAFAEYGRNYSEKIGADRQKQIAKRIAEGATSNDLVAAVHGYVREHGGLEVQPNGYDPDRWFKPATIFKAEGFSDRVDAASRPMPTARREAPQKPNYAERTVEYNNESTREALRLFDEENERESGLRLIGESKGLAK